MNGRKIEIKPTDVKVLGRAVSITTDKTLVAAEQTVDESFDPNKNYPGTFEDHSQWTINRLLKSKIDALSSGIPSDIEPATTDKYGIVRLASDANDSDPWDVVTMNLFKPFYTDFYDDSLDSSGFWFKGVKPTVDLLKQCCAEVKQRIETLEKKNPDIINLVPNTTIADASVNQASEDSEANFSCRIVANPGYYIKDCYGVTADDVEYISDHNHNPYPTSRTIMAHSQSELIHDIYIQGSTELLPDSYHAISVRGEGVDSTYYAVNSQTSGFSFSIEPQIGYQRYPNNEHQPPRLFVSTNPNDANIDFTYGDEEDPDERNFITGVVDGTLSTDVVVDTGRFYKKIQAPLQFITENCSISPSGEQRTGIIFGNKIQCRVIGIENDLDGNIKYGEDITGDIVLNEGCVLKSVKVYADYEGYHKDYDVNLIDLHFIVSDVQFDFFDAVEMIQGHYTGTTPKGEGMLQTVTNSMIGSKFGPVIKVEVIAEETIQYPITWNGSNYTATNSATSWPAGQAFTTVISPVSGYDITKVTVTHNGKSVPTSIGSNGKCTINIASVNGPVSISVTTQTVAPPAPETQQYKVTYTGDISAINQSLDSLPQVVEQNTLYQATITAKSGYTITNIKIVKTANTSEIINSTYSNGKLTSSVNITEDITVVISSGDNFIVASIYPTGAEAGYDAWLGGDMPGGQVRRVRVPMSANINQSFPNSWSIVTNDTNLYTGSGNNKHLWGSGPCPFGYASSVNYTSMSGYFDHKDRDVTGKLKILKTSGAWSITCESHYISDFDSIPSQADIKNGNLSNHYLDDLFGRPQPLTFSETSGGKVNGATANKIITFTAQPDYQNAVVLHEITINVDGGLSPKYEWYNKLYVTQRMSQQSIGARSGEYSASCYSTGCTTTHQFLGDWQRVELASDGVTYTPVTDQAKKTFTFDNGQPSKVQATLSALSGSASDVLTITSQTNCDKDWIVSSKDRASGNDEPHYLYFRETIDGVNTINKFIFAHGYNNPTDDKTPVWLIDHVHSDNYIEEVTLFDQQDNPTTIPVTDSTPSVNIAGYDVTDRLSVVVHDVSGITSDNIQVIYKIGFYDNPDVSQNVASQNQYVSSRGYSPWDEDTENALWVNVPFEYDNGIITFDLNSGMFAPTLAGYHATDSQGYIWKAPWWNYIIKITEP